MRNPDARHLVLAAIVASAVAALSGCAPVLQDARLLDPGKVSLTPNLSGVVVSDNGRSDYVATVAGVQLLAGLRERLNLAVAYGRFEIRDGEDNGGLNGVAFGPKFGVVRDRVAVLVPVSFAFGGGTTVSDTWEVHPTVAFTRPMTPKVDFNPVVRLLIPTCENCDVLLGLSAGFGLHVAPRVVIRPEVGALFKPRESGVVWTFGGGVSLQ